MTDEQFDLQAAMDQSEAYHPPAMEVLPKGLHQCVIVDVEVAKSSGGHAMIKLRVENEEGAQWDNLVISPNQFAIDKLNGLADSAGVMRAKVGADIKQDEGSGLLRLNPKWADQLMAKRVGVRVVDEEDNRDDHKGEWRPRIKGYRQPETDSGTPDVSTASAPASTGGVPDDDDIPF